ncbi:MAG TPA: hypothetical protein VLV83_05600 [Acidobacteriota bacterium]|nr:hypothetical protein [Acidobacteriota bacterium]
MLLLLACGQSGGTSQSPEDLLAQVRSRLDGLSSLQYRFHYRGTGMMAGEYRGSMKIRPADKGGRPSMRARIEDWSSSPGRWDKLEVVIRLSTVYIGAQ